MSERTGSRTVLGTMPSKLPLIRAPMIESTADALKAINKHLPALQALLRRDTQR